MCKIVYQHHQIANRRRNVLAKLRKLIIDINLQLLNHCESSANNRVVHREWTLPCSSSRSNLSSWTRALHRLTRLRTFRKLIQLGRLRWRKINKRMPKSCLKVPVAQCLVQRRRRVRRRFKIAIEAKRACLSLKQAPSLGTQSQHSLPTIL